MTGGKKREGNTNKTNRHLSLIRLPLQAESGQRPKLSEEEARLAAEVRLLVATLVSRSRQKKTFKTEKGEAKEGCKVCLQMKLDGTSASREL